MQMRLVCCLAALSLVFVSVLSMASETESSLTIGMDESSSSMVHFTEATLVDDLEQHLMESEIGIDDIFVESESESETTPKPQTPRRPTSGSSRPVSGNTGGLTKPAKGAGKASAPAAAAGRKPAAARLTEAENQAKFAIHVKNTNAKFATPAEKNAAYTAFKANRQKIVYNNDKYSTALNPKPFSSAGRFGSWTPSKFKTLLNTKHPSKRTGGRHVKAKPRRAGAAAGAAGAAKPGKAGKAGAAAAAAPRAAKPAAAAAKGKKARFAEVDLDAEADAEAEADADADADAFVETEAESEVDADSELDAEIDAEAEVESELETEMDSELDAALDMEVDAESEVNPWTPSAAQPRGRTAGSAGGTASSAGGSASSAGGSASSAGGSASSAGGAASSAGGSASSAGGAASSAGGSASSAGGAASSAGGSASSAGGSASSAGGAASSAGGSASSAGGSASSAGGSASSAGGAASSAGGSASSAGGAASAHVVAPTGPAAGFAGAAEQFNSIDQAFAAIKNAGGRTDSLDDAFKKSETRVKFFSTRDLPQQGQCGSCWAHAAIGALENALKVANKFRAPLSVQNIIDCVKSSDSAGCEGGTPMDALDYAKVNPIQLDADYNYTGIVGECKAEVPKGQKFLSNGWSAVAGVCTKDPCPKQNGVEGDILRYLINNKVSLMAYVDGSQWANYASGLFPTSRCSSASVDGNHVIQIVGWGSESILSPTQANNKASQKYNAPYWLIRNSWGTNWGEGGFIKLPFGVNACGISNFVAVANPIN